MKLTEWRRRLLLSCIVLANATLGQAGETTVSIDGRTWLINGRTTYPGAAAEGLLMNVRMVNAVFEDDRDKSLWHDRLPQDFDPERNTDAFIARIPEYVGSGIRAFTVSLQGGNPGYEGAHNSAFNGDGGLRTAYMARVKRIIEACDAHGAVIILSVLYQRQHGRSPTFLPRALNGRSAIRAAVSNVAGWVKQNGFTNVVIEIANEYPHSGYANWVDGDWLRSVPGQVELINHARAAHPQVLVSTSGYGNGKVAAEVAGAADFVTLHMNIVALADYAALISTARSYGKPVIINEDDKIGDLGANAARRAVDAGAGWGFMHSRQNQYAPFAFAGTEDDALVYDRVKQSTASGSVAPAAPTELSVE